MERSLSTRERTKKKGEKSGNWKEREKKKSIFAVAALARPLRQCPEGGRKGSPGPSLLLYLT
jgi:hypothetical protein